MQTSRSIARDTWTAFLDEVTAERRGAPVTLIIDWENLGEEVEAHDVLLDSIDYDPRGDVLRVVARRPSPGRHTMLRHHIDAPIAVDVDSPAGILPGELRVTGRDGAATIVKITPGPVLSS